MEKERLEALERDAARYRWLRDAKPCQLLLYLNDHASNYQTAAEWIEDGMDNEDITDTPPAELERMKEAGTVWWLQIYPNTPIGFNVWYRSSLDAVIDAAMAEQ